MFRQWNVFVYSKTTNIRSRNKYFQCRTSKQFSIQNLRWSTCFCSCSIREYVVVYNLNRIGDTFRNFHFPPSLGSIPLAIQPTVFVFSGILVPYFLISLQEMKWSILCCGVENVRMDGNFREITIIMLAMKVLPYQWMQCSIILLLEKLLFHIFTKISLIYKVSRDLTWFLYL